MPRLLKTRAGFTLAEVMVALVLTGVIGAAVTSVFVTQSKFFDTQEKVGFARGVSRGAMNLIMSELRMIEQGGGLRAATNTKISVRAPFAMGIVCGNTSVLTISRLPADSAMVANAAPSGYAFREPDSTYTYIVGAPAVLQNNGGSICAVSNIAIVTEGGINGGPMQIMGLPAKIPPIGAPIFLYQDITYEFKASLNFPGRVALWRRLDEIALDEELVAPFDTTAKFRFYVSDAAVAQTAVPAQLNTITGLELILDGLSDRPDRNGNPQRVPLTTSVFFKNRP